MIFKIDSVVSFKLIPIGVLHSQIDMRVGHVQRVNAD